MARRMRAFRGKWHQFMGIRSAHAVLLKARQLKTSQLHVGHNTWVNAIIGQAMAGDGGFMEVRVTG